MTGRRMAIAAVDVCTGIAIGALANGGVRMAVAFCLGAMFFAVLAVFDNREES